MVGKRTITLTIALACATLGATATAGRHGPPARAADGETARGPARAGEDEQSHRAAKRFVPGEVVLGLRDGGEHVVRLPGGLALPEAKSLLEGLPEVGYANRNWTAQAAVMPLDRGDAGTPGGWRAEQWNFLGRPGGVRAIRTWHRLAADGRPGARGVKIAIVDTGIAYTDSDEPPGFRASPGFTAASAFGPGRDFVEGGPPLDRNGHGTHIAGTIAEQVTLGKPASEGDPDYLTGLAHNATLLPVRVLDERGEGTAATVAKGIRWATKHGADVINVSLQLPPAVRRCGQVRIICRAVRKARRAGALVVAAAGNTPGGHPQVLFPAAAPGAVAVGAATEGGCLASYSHHGRRLDLIAPGGGGARAAVARPRCKGDRRFIHQVSFECFNPRRSCPRDYTEFAIVPARGTSMAAAHVSAVAAMVRAGRAGGRKTSPQRVLRRLRCSARRLGKRWFHGAGLLDAARATRRRAPPRCRR